MADSSYAHRGRIGAHVLHATHDSKLITQAARDASPGSLTYWEREVDKEGALDAVERDSSRLFNSDESEVRAIMRADFVVANPSAVVRITGLRP